MVSKMLLLLYLIYQLIDLDYFRSSISPKGTCYNVGIRDIIGSLCLSAKRSLLPFTPSRLNISVV